MRGKIGIEITDGQDGTASIFIAIHASDVEPRSKTQDRDYVPQRITRPLPG
jgi:hypothetical protein